MLPCTDMSQIKPQLIKIIPLTCSPVMTCLRSNFNWSYLSLAPLYWHVSDQTSTDPSSHLLPCNDMSQIKPQLIKIIPLTCSPVMTCLRSNLNWLKSYLSLAPLYWHVSDQTSTDPTSHLLPCTDMSQIKPQLIKIIPLTCSPVMTCLRSNLIWLKSYLSLAPLYWHVSDQTSTDPTSHLLPCTDMSQIKPQLILPLTCSPVLTCLRSNLNWLKSYLSLAPL